ncbi:MAG: hypothetical protein ACI81R_000281 [Bradymonadia bacterium]|jgi:hypothetical protein
MRSACRQVISLLPLLVLCCMARSAFAQSDPLDDPLRSLSWGVASSEVLSAERERLLDGYRLEIAGESDPIAIDAVRREMEEGFEAISGSLQVFAGARTGYEVSVLRSQVAAGVSQQLLTVRGDVFTTYYIFEDDALRRIVVAMDQAALAYIGFEEFVSSLAAALGETSDEDWAEDELGIATLLSANWLGERTTLQTVDESAMFASFVLSYTDVSWAAPTVGTVDVAPAVGEDAVGSIMDRLRSRDDATASNDDVVDELIGRPTEVILQLPEPEEPQTVEEAAEAEAEEERVRRRRTSPREPEQEDESDQIVY